MPSSMLKLSRLQLFHLGQVREQPILRNAEQHAQAQQTATFSPWSGKRSTHSEGFQAACSSTADCNFLPGSGKRSTHSEGFQAACTSSADCNLGLVGEQLTLRNAKQHAQAHQTVTISYGSGKRATYSEEGQAAYSSSADCNYLTWVR